MMSKSFHLSTKFKEKFKERIYKRGDNDYCKGISTLVGAGILNFLVGAIFSLCTLSVYEISYIKAKGGSISIDHLTFYYPIEIIFQYISAFFSGKIYDDLGLHITNLIGTTILTLGYFIMYMSSSLLMDLSSMIVGGIGTGIILYPSTTNAIEWFTQHNGIIMGIMETMISFGSFFFAFIGEIIINKEKIPSHADDNLYDYDIGKKIKLYLIIQIIALDCAFLISYGLMFEKEEDDEEDILKDLENETHVIRFETTTDINEHIEQNDEHFDANIKINEKNNEEYSDSDNKNQKEISGHSNVQKSELENKKDKKPESEGEKKEENIKNKINDELIKEKNEENKSMNKEENINIDKEKKVIEKDTSNENKQDNNKSSKENNESNKNNIKEEKEEPLLTKKQKESGKSSSDDEEEDSEEKKRILKQALKSKRLILFSAIVILQAPVANMAFSLYREIGEYYKIDLKYLQLVGSLYFIFECLSSFVFGLLCDYIQLKYLLFFINGVGTFVGFIYCLTFKNGLIFFLVQNFLSFSAGGYYPVKDCYLMKVFGKDIYIELSGYVSFLVAISVNLITPIAYFVQSELKEKGLADAANWILFISFGVMNLIGLILNIFIQETPIIFDDNEEDIEAIDVNQL